MASDIDRHPAVKITYSSFADYRRKTLDISELQRNLSTARSLLDGSLPKQVRESIEWAENEIEGAQFTTGKSDQPAEVDRVWREVEEVLTRHGAVGKADED